MFNQERLACIILTATLLAACADTSASSSPDNTHATTETSQPEAPSQTVDEGLRQDALGAGLLVVASYFEETPEAFLEHLGDNLPTIGDPLEWIMGKAEFTVTVQSQTPFPAGLDLSNYSMEDYHQTFVPRVLSYQEAVAQGLITAVSGNRWVPGVDEFIFDGSTLQAELHESDRFLWNSLNVFVVGIRNGEWKLIGFAPSSFVD